MRPPRATAVERPLLLVSVGSDHHPFPRLLQWVDEYLRTSAHAARTRYVCQHGTAPAARCAEASYPFLPYEQLQGLMRDATAIVVQGGPYSMLESMRNGRIPIVVPRTRRLGEAVDDHQSAFCSLLAGRGQVVLATTADDLHRALDRALTEPESFAAPETLHEQDRADTVRRFAAAVEECRPTRRLRLLQAVPNLVRPPVRRLRATESPWHRETMGSRSYTP